MALSAAAAPAAAPSNRSNNSHLWKQGILHKWQGYRLTFRSPDMFAPARIPVAAGK